MTAPSAPRAGEPDTDGTHRTAFAVSGGMRAICGPKQKIHGRPLRVSTLVTVHHAYVTQSCLASD